MRRLAYSCHAIEKRWPFNIRSGKPVSLLVEEGTRKGVSRDEFFDLAILRAPRRERGFCSSSFEEEVKLLRAGYEALIQIVGRAATSLLSHVNLEMTFVPW